MTDFNFFKMIKDASMTYHCVCCSLLPKAFTYIIVYINMVGWTEF